MGLSLYIYIANPHLTSWGFALLHSCGAPSKDFSPRLHCGAPLGRRWTGERRSGFPVGVWGTWSIQVCQSQICWDHGTLDKWVYIPSNCLSSNEIGFLKKNKPSIYGYPIYWWCGYLRTLTRTVIQENRLFAQDLLSLLANDGSRRLLGSGAAWRINIPILSTFQRSAIVLLHELQWLSSPCPSLLLIGGVGNGMSILDSVQLELQFIKFFGNWKLDPRLVKLDGGCTTTKGLLLRDTLRTATVLQC